MRPKRRGVCRDRVCTTADEPRDLLHERMVLLPGGHNVMKHETHADVAGIRLRGSKFTGSHPEGLPLGLNLVLPEARARCRSRLIHSHFNADGSTRHREHEIRLLTLIDFIGRNIEDG